MFDPFIYLLFAVLGLTLFFGTVPLIVAARLGDKARVERLLDLYTEVFAAGAAAIHRHAEDFPAEGQLAGNSNRDHEETAALRWLNATELHRESSEKIFPFHVASMSRGAAGNVWEALKQTGIFAT